MGEPIADKRWSDARKKQLRDSRVVGTRALVDALRDLPRRPRLLISASGAGYYGDRGDEILTENAAAGSGFLAELARDWEAEAMRAADIGLRVVVLRNGVVLSKRSGILRKILPPFRLGLGGRVGSGAQWLPWIHLEDQIGLDPARDVARGRVGPAQLRRARAGHERRSSRARWARCWDGRRC